MKHREDLADGRIGDPGEKGFQAFAFDELQCERLWGRITLTLRALQKNS